MGAIATGGRRWATLLAGAALVLAVGSGCGGDSTDSPDGFFGIAPAAPLTADDLARMERGNVGTLRVVAFWPAVQAGPTEPLNWNETDAFVAGAAAHGMQPIITLYGPIPGADPGLPTDDPSAEQIWRGFVQGAVERYGPEGSFWTEHESLPYRPVTTWQVWNEPNLSIFWEDRRVSARSYAELVALTAPVIRGADPDAEVILAGLSGRPSGKRSQWATLFLDELYRVPSIEDHFDAVDLHPYSRSVAGVRDRIEEARALMDENRDSETGIWLTEIGWSSPGRPGSKQVTTVQGQADLLAGSMGMLYDQRDEWGIRGAIWFTWKDDPQSSVCGWCGGAGLIAADGQPKPAWNRFTELTGGRP